MLDPVDLLEKAKTSSLYRWLLNRVMARMIPFNLPHGFEILELSDTHIKTRLPFKRKNKNHLGGLHACALATLSEYSVGVLLLTQLNPKEYRFILQRLEIDYHYQGKMDSFAEFRIAENFIEEQILEPLKTQEAVALPCEVSIRDAQGNQLTTAIVHFQLKPWSKVRTKRAEAAETA